MAISRTSVLVIDDNAALAENIAEILEELGVEAHLAESAEAALERFNERDWSLVVTDVRMPGLDGIELLALIKERSPGTPVLVMTGYADVETVARAHDSGALAVVNKPLDLDALLELVERIAAAHKAILVLDDDLALVGNLTEILSEERGVLPHPATSVALARKLATAIDFKVAVIDLRLPDGDGLTLAHELLRRPEHDCSIIILTGHPEQLDSSVGLETHERLVVLTKPVPIPRLLECVREAWEVGHGGRSSSPTVQEKLR
jgi:DNA-binding NtrC family response regulator